AETRPRRPPLPVQPLPLAARAVRTAGPRAEPRGAVHHLLRLADQPEPDHAHPAGRPVHHPQRGEHRAAARGRQRGRGGGDRVRRRRAGGQGHHRLRALPVRRDEGAARPRLAGEPSADERLAQARGRDPVGRPREVQGAGQGRETQRHDPGERAPAAREPAHPPVGGGGPLGRHAQAPRLGLQDRDRRGLRLRPGMRAVRPDRRPRRRSDPRAGAPHRRPGHL
ncbi:MAG: Carbonic anhydrase, beta class, partial [uncultured Phycisphaerae bacterium]